MNFEGEMKLESVVVDGVESNIFYPVIQPWAMGHRPFLTGSSLMSLSLGAAYRTIPSNFSIHSLYTTFILPGHMVTPVQFHVEHIGIPRKFITVVVKVMQEGACITMSNLTFKKASKPSERGLEYAPPMPIGLTEPDELIDDIEWAKSENGGSAQAQRMPLPKDQTTINSKEWLRIKPRLSTSASRQIHHQALVYLSDLLIIDTPARVHGLYYLKESETGIAPGTLKDNLADVPVPQVLTTLNNTIHFHNAETFRADEWLLQDTTSPWAHDCRLEVRSNIFSRDGTLIATCVQEGFMTLQERRPEKL